MGNVEEYALRIETVDGSVSTASMARLPFTIGREQDNDLVLDDLLVSRHHASFCQTSDGLTVIDNRSRNGTFLNRKKISGGEAVRPGDTVRIGWAQIKIELADVPDIPDRSRRTDTVKFFAPKGWDPLETITSHITADAAKDGDVEDRGDSGQEGLVGQGVSSGLAMLRFFLDAPLAVVYEQILDIIEERVSFDRAFVILFEEGDPRQTNIVGRRVRKRTSEDVIISQDILRRVHASRESVVVTTGDLDFSPSDSFLQSGAATALCVPLIVQECVNGVIYVGHQATYAADSQDPLEAIGQLAGLVAMKIEHVLLLEEHVAAQVMERDLNLAKEILEKLLPQDPLLLPDCQVEGYTDPCYDVGGDYIDYFRTADSECFLVIGDVSGKGLPSALYAAGVRAALHAHVDDGLPVEAIMGRLERHVESTFRSDHFLTLFIGKLEAKSGMLTYCNAGHMKPICLRAAGEVIELADAEPALNLTSWKNFRSRQFRLRRGDLLLLYTDGLTESENDQRQQFGSERLRDCLLECRRESLAHVREHVLSSIEAFTGGQAAADDRTIILVRAGVGPAVGDKKAPRATEAHPFGEANEVFRAVFPSRLDAREVVIRDALTALVEDGCTLDSYIDRLCLDELISNAIIHGNGEDPAKEVTVRAFHAEGTWGFEVTDEGVGFDRSTIDEALRKPVDDVRPTGRGLALIDAAGGEIHLLNHGRCVVVVRRHG